MASSATPLPESEKKLQKIGLALYIVGQLIGGTLLVGFLLLPPLFSDNAGRALGLMCMAAFLALPAGVMYLTVPRLLDRYDPEPWYALLGILFWGAIAACGFSGVINTGVGLCGFFVGGEAAAETLSAVVSAPIVEEGFKGLGVFGVFFFLRREFDGVVDGIIYATFVAIGFAAVENVIYYARAAEQGGALALTGTFVFRGIIAPWGHPVYTAMTGIGFGVARETETPWVRYTAPFIGYGGACLLHAIWNGSATLAGSLGESGLIFFLVSLLVWFVFVGVFLLIVITLVRRRGRIIRQFLQDEVVFGHLTQDDVELVGSAFGLLKARSRWGKKGGEYARAVARLSLSKWHTARAQKTKNQTVSMDFILPLRARIKELKHELGIPMGTPYRK